MRISLGSVVCCSIDKRLGYAWVVHKDWFGSLFAVYDVFEAPIEVSILTELKPRGHLFINHASMKSKWKAAGRLKVTSASRFSIPVFYYGLRSVGWTIDFSDHSERVKGADFSIDDFEAKGYVHRVLFLAVNVENFWRNGSWPKWDGPE